MENASGWLPAVLAVDHHQAAVGKGRVAWAGGVVGAVVAHQDLPSSSKRKEKLPEPLGGRLDSAVQEPARNFQAAQSGEGFWGAAPARFSESPRRVSSLRYTVFSGSDDAFPVGGLVRSTSGDFYRTTMKGGSSSIGAIFTRRFSTKPPVGRRRAGWWRRWSIMRGNCSPA